MAEAERTWMYSKRTPDSYTRLLRATNEQYNLALNSHFSGGAIFCVSTLLARTLHKYTQKLAIYAYIQD